MRWFCKFEKESKKRWYGFANIKMEIWLGQVGHNGGGRSHHNIQAFRNPHTQCWHNTQTFTPFAYKHKFMWWLFLHSEIKSNRLYHFLFTKHLSILFNLPNLHKTNTNWNDLNWYKNILKNGKYKLYSSI